MGDGEFAAALVVGTVGVLGIIYLSARFLDAWGRSIDEANRRDDEE